MIIQPGNDPFCSNIRYLRKRYALSQRAFSRLTGVSIFTLRDWEAERVTAALTSWQLKRICAVFDVPAEILLNSALPPERDENTM